MTTVRRFALLSPGFASVCAAACLASACVPKHHTDIKGVTSALNPLTCIAVLPFENLSDDSAAGDAFADLVATELLRAGRFHVMDRAESARILSTRGIYLTNATDAATIRALGDVLGVQAIVMGTVSEYRFQESRRRDRPDRPLVGVKTRLVDVKTGDNVWGASFDGSPTSFFGDSTAPMHLAAQRVAEGMSVDLVEASGASKMSGAPCWDSKAQSVLATLAPGVDGRSAGTTASRATATPRPMATATPVAMLTLPPTPTPTPSPMGTMVAAVSTPAPTPTPAATPATAPAKPLTDKQSAMRDKMKDGAQFPLEGVAFVGITNNMTPASDAVLKDLAAVLVAHPETKLRIEAHVDPTDAGPVPMSQKRAEAIVAKLQTYGAAATALEPKGMGGSKSMFPSFVEAMKLKNRRIEVGVLSAPVAGAAVPGGTTGGTPVATAEPARVKVLAAKGSNASAVKLANTLKQQGTKVTTVAAVPEARATTLVYFTPAHREEATKLASSIGVKGGAKLSPAKQLGPGIDIVIVVGADLK